MEIKISQSSKPGAEVSQQEIFKQSGKYAGVCYMKDDYTTLNQEDEIKSFKRAKGTLINGHHSVFGHTFITLTIEGAPKLFAMLLNNEKDYNTSEKSARYTEMKDLSTEIEKEIYDKWKEKLIQVIKNKYGNEKYFDDKRISKLAAENARYFTSVMTPTTFVHTVSYRQLNYICGWLSNMKDTTIDLYKLLIPTAEEFINQIKDLGLLSEIEMQDGKNRSFSLIGSRVRGENFNETYSINYLGSYAEFAQAQRHRTLDYEFTRVDADKRQYFCPEILNDYPELVNEWNADMHKVVEAGVIPQGELVLINERGTYENLILKAKERLCTAAQYEINKQTKATIERYISETPDKVVKEELEKALVSQNGVCSRCTKGFICATPCEFKNGILGERDI